MVKFEEVPAHKVEEDISSDSDSETDMPTLENAKDQAAGHVKLNRAEKKARKAMEKVGMKPIPDINRVIVRRGKTMTFAITQPDVMKSPNSDLYIIFGVPKFEDAVQQNQANAAQRFTHTPEVSKVSSSSPVLLEEEETGPVDETGIEPKDIELVMSQVSCSRSKAVRALRGANGDIVEAIMQLSA